MLSRRDLILAGVGAAFSRAPFPRVFRSAYAAKTNAKTWPTAVTKPNVLFIAVDDLRPLLGCYGDSQAHTPHIDRLAKEGLLFKRAYCQQAICSPSRSSLLTGRRPDTTRVYYNQTHFRTHIPNVVTLPQHFKAHGYHTQSLGKVYHGKSLDDERSWSVPSAWFTNAPPYHMPESLARVTTITRQGRTRRTGPSWECSDNDDHAHNDGQIADAAIETLQKLKDTPFFLAVGFRKPHLPFVAPKTYFDLHPSEKFRLPANDEAPQGAPAWAMHNWGELRNYVDMPEKGPLSREKAIELIRAYYAATSFIDAQIGRVLKALDENGLRQNTVWS